MLLHFVIIHWIQKEKTMNSLRTQMALIFAAILLVGTVLISLTSYANSRQLVVDTMGRQAMNIAEHARSVIDPVVFQSIVPEAGETEAYFALREKLNEIRETNGLKYLYTMRVVEEDGVPAYQYVVDGMPPDSDEASALGDIEDESNIDDSMAELFRTGEPQVGALDYTEEYGATLSAYLPIVDASGAVIGLVGADFDADDVYALLEKNKWNSVLIGVIVMLGSFAVIFIVANLLVRPLRSLIRSLGEVARGNLQVSVATTRKDEIGQLSVAFQQTVDELGRLIHTIQSNANVLNRSASDLHAHVQEAERSSREMNRSMEEIAAGSQTQLQLSVDTSRSIADVAGGVNRIAAASAEVAGISETTMREAEKGSAHIESVINQMSAIQETSETMRQMIDRLNAHSERIGEIADTIAAIASSTNILSLNAGIEASRAGESGKGFAVVAVEIRKLAAQASASSEQIAQTIETVRKDTRDAALSMERNLEEVEAGRRLAAEAGQAFQAILAAIRRTVSQFAEVSTTSEQLAAGAEKVSVTVNEVAEIAKQAAHHFEMAAGASMEEANRIGQIVQAIQDLKQMAVALEEHVKKFQV
jgi:methyl-accepting chemotaxis protein